MARAVLEVAQEFVVPLRVALLEGLAPGVLPVLEVGVVFKSLRGHPGRRCRVQVMVIAAVDIPACTGGHRMIACHLIIL